MPAVALTEKQKFNRAFIRIYERSLANSKAVGKRITHKQVASLLGISSRAWEYQRTDPWGKVSGQTIFALVHFLGWSADDLAKLYRPKPIKSDDAA